MRPERKRRLSLQTAISRARMYLKANLDWLKGFPVGQSEGRVDWIYLSQAGSKGVQRIQLTRHHLHRAQFAVNKLKNRFPRAFPRIVDDPDLWTQQVDQLLSWLKEAIHDGKQLPSAPVAGEIGLPRVFLKRSARVADRCPAITPLLNAASWLVLLESKEANKALDWIETHGTELEAFLSCRSDVEGLIAAVILWDLDGRDGERYTETLLRFLSDSRSFTVPVEFNHDEWVARLVSPQSTPVAESEQRTGLLGQKLMEFLNWVHCQRRATRRRALELLSLCLPIEVLDSWKQWWPRCLEAFRKAVDEWRIGKVESDVQVKDQFLSRVGAIPSRVHADLLLANIRRAADSDNQALCDQMLKTLRCLPVYSGSRLVRPAFLHHWLAASSQEYRLEGTRLLESQTAIVRLVEHFCSFVTRYLDAESLTRTPWKAVIREWHSRKPPPWGWYLVEAVIVELLEERDLWPLVFDVMGQLCRDFGHKLENVEELIVPLVRITQSTNRSVAFFNALSDAGLRKQHVSWRVLECAAELAPGDLSFAQIVSILHAAERREEGSVGAISTAIQALREAGWKTVARAMVANKELPILSFLGHQLQILARFDDPAPPLPHADIPEVPSWAERFPNDLHEPLALLSAVTPDAEVMARRILKRNFRDPEGIERELIVLRSKLSANPDNVNLRKRLENLIQRKGGGATVSPVRLARLTGKLNCAIGRCVVRSWQLRLDQKLLEVLVKVIQIETIPDWLFQPNVLELIAEIVRLKPRFRRLGVQLIRKRCGPAPWDLADEPSNQDFIKRLRHLGVNPDPWVEPPAPHTVLGKNARSVRLNFEKDPLEIMRMGQYFGTCLSPGHCNFFSTIANAADINKHVVFARDHGGRVVGRCLLALTDQGRILTFHPYCHDSGLGFGEMVGRVTEDLAARMGARVAMRGQVSSLLAPRWYDDGPEDVCGRFTFLQSDSPLRKQLPSIPLPSLISALSSACDPLPLDELTLPLIVALDEFDQRPELIGPLIPLIQDCDMLPREFWLRAATLAYEAGAMEFAYRVVTERAVPYLLRMNRVEGVLGSTVVSILIKVRPSAALRVLRATRPRGVRADEEEEANSIRRSLLADAHEALGRTNLARRLRPSD